MEFTVSNVSGVASSSGILISCFFSRNALSETMEKLAPLPAEDLLRSVPGEVLAFLVVGAHVAQDCLPEVPPGVTRCCPVVSARRSGRATAPAPSWCSALAPSVTASRPRESQRRGRSASCATSKACTRTRLAPRPVPARSRIVAPPTRLTRVSRPRSRARSVRPGGNTKGPEHGPLGGEPRAEVLP